MPLVLLHAVAEAAEDAVPRGLAHLQAAEFLYETRLFPEPEYTFKHALTHEVTYGTILRDRRKALHARIVGAIERSHPDRLTEHVDRLADHAVRGELWKQAVTYLHQAGVKALTRSANREAAASFEQALAALGHLPESREGLEQAIDPRFDVRTALFPLGEFEQTFGHLREAEGLAQALDDQRRLGRLSVYMCHYPWMTGRPTEALTFGERARVIAESLGDVPLQVTGHLYLGAACLGTGAYREAQDLLRKVVELLDGALGRERLGLAGFPIVMAHFYLTWALTDRGRFTEGIGQGEEGIPLRERALSGSAAMRQGAALPFLLAWLSEAHLLARRFADALELAERSLTLARANGRRPDEAWALRLLGEVAARRDLPEHADAHYRNALTLAEEVRMRPLVGHCHLGLGQLYQRTGQRERAGKHLATATRMYHEMEMRLWLEQAEMAMTELA